MNRFEVRVESGDWLRLGRTRLACRRWPGLRAGARAAVRIRPQDVLLCAGHPGRVSARNILPGHARSVKLVPEGAYVRLDVGFPLTALVTRGAVADLGIRAGTALFAVIKATAIVPEANVRPRFRAAVVGARGEISPERVDFLRALDRAGSLSAAAREIGLSFRSAWSWMTEVNRAWGEPLVFRVRGGRGGGGAELTPAGRALLEEVERFERR